MCAYPVIREQHKITRGYTAFHKGVDIAPIKRGVPEPVYAVGAGVISHVGVGTWRSGKNFILKLDGDGSLWWYTHLSTIGDIKVGDRFADGDQLARAMTGNTGFSFGVHVHLVRFAGFLDWFTDPWPFIRNEPNPRGGLKPGPKPVPAKMLHGVKVGDFVKISRWVGYSVSRLPLGRQRALLSGTFAVVDIKNGAYRVRGGGRDAWIRMSAAQARAAKR